MRIEGRPGVLVVRLPDARLLRAAQALELEIDGGVDLFCLLEAERAGVREEMEVMLRVSSARQEALEKDPEERFQSVRDVSFALEPGQMVMLIGPNGSGKTTLLRAILGLIASDGGYPC